MIRTSIAKSIASYTEKKTRDYLRNLKIQSASKIPRIPDDFKSFNEMIGLPPLFDKKKTAKVFPYQVDIDKAINENHKVIINKSRKIGATETVLRSIAKNCLGRYAGYNVMIVAGNRQDQAEAILDRFTKLFEKGFTDLDGMYFSYHDIIKKKTRSNVELFNKTIIKTYPANAEAVRGPDRVVCVFLDEAAHIKQIDDSQVYDALKPNLANTDGDFILVSTPNGRRGIFYDLWEKGGYQKLELPYTLAMGELLSEEFIEAEKKDTRIDFEQEYECKFTTSSRAVFKPGDIKYHDFPLVDLDSLK